MDRVQKIMCNAGYCSRRKAEEIIKAGRVKVNGKKITLGDQASPDDTITIDGKQLKRERKIYLAFHKPTGCVTALKDEKLRTIMHYIKLKERVFPVGRLDYNTSGLLLLTNDGDFANTVAHPRYEVKKTYTAELDTAISDKKVQRLTNGIMIDGKKAKADKVRVIKPTVLEITLHEGRNRIVRKLFEKLGHRVIALKRTRIGKMRLGDIEPGKYIKLKGPPEI